MINVIHNKLCSKKDIKSVFKLIEREKDSLDSIAKGMLIRHDDSLFKALRIDRNAILELDVPEVRGKLIVKFLCSLEKKYKDNTRWEAKQWEALNATSKIIGFVKLPSLVAFNEDSGILVMEKIDGYTANTIIKQAYLYREVISKIYKTNRKFYRLGMLLGLLHSRCPYETSSPIYYSTSDKLRSFETAAQCDKVLENGILAFSQKDKSNQERCWVHGNLKPDNIVFMNGDVVLIDMENAGAGYAMDDVGRLLACIIMFGRFPFFPKRYLRSVVTSFLAGYCSTGNISWNALIAATLGEVLVAYGRITNESRFTWRYFKSQLANIIMHLVKILHNSQKELPQKPGKLIA